MIDPKKLYSYFDSTYPLKKTTNGWWMFDCPECGKENKAAVQFHYNIVKCWVCGYKKYAVNFVADQEGCTYFEALDILHNRKASNTDLDYSVVNHVKVDTSRYIEMPKGFNTVLEGEGVLAERARETLRKRGFDLEEMDFEGFGYCNEQCTETDLSLGKEDFFGYIIVPFKVRGRLVYYIGRDFIGNYLRYKNPKKELFGLGKGDLLFNGDALNIYEECYLVEGWADAKTLGPSAMSSQGWSLSGTQKSAIYGAEVCNRLTFVPDAGSDDTGELFYTKALRVACDFAEEMEVRVVDLNPYADKGKDVNELGIDLVEDAIENTGWMDYGMLINKIVE